MVDIAAIAGAAGALKNAYDLSKAALSLHDASLLRGKVIEMQSEISSALASAIAAQTEQMSALEEIRTLKAEMASLKNWEREKERYELQQFEPGIIIPCLKPAMAQGEPPHRICPTCYTRDKKSFLQCTTAHSGQEHLKCHDCGSTFTIGRFVPPSAHNARPSYGRGR